MQRRQGFTLVEMMVATALTLFIMVILSEAFITALDTFRGLKAIGDLQENLRTATNNLRFDLQQDHFEGTRRLSHPNIATTPIVQGFFAVYQGSGSVAEGTDNDQGISSVRATNDILHFSVSLRGSATGNRPESFLSAPGTYQNLFTANYYNKATNPAYDAFYVTQPTTIFNSQWAEIAYFLCPTGSTNLPNALGGTGTPLFGLYRAQLAVVNNTQLLPTVKKALKNFRNLSCTNTGVAGSAITFYSPRDLAAGRRTLNPANLNLAMASGTAYKRGSLSVLANNRATMTNIGATLVAKNVLSFDVQVMPFAKGALVAGADFTDGSYDTSVQPFPLTGVQVSIRVWDPQTQQTRQITIIQDQ